MNYLVLNSWQTNQYQVWIHSHGMGYKYNQRVMGYSQNFIALALHVGSSVIDHMVCSWVGIYISPLIACTVQ